MGKFLLMSVVFTTVLIPLLAAREPLYAQARLTVDTTRGETSTVESVERLLAGRPAAV